MNEVIHSRKHVRRTKGTRTTSIDDKVTCPQCKEIMKYESKESGLVNDKHDA